MHQRDGGRRLRRLPSVRGPGGKGEDVVAVDCFTDYYDVARKGANIAGSCAVPVGGFWPLLLAGLRLPAGRGRADYARTSRASRVLRIAARPDCVRPLTREPSCALWQAKRQFRDLPALTRGPTYGKDKIVTATHGNGRPTMSQLGHHAIRSVRRRRPVEDDVITRGSRG